MTTEPSRPAKPRSHLRRWSLAAAAILFGLPLLALAAVWLLALASLPDLEGEVALAGLEAEATILRDDDGIVTVRASSETDAAMALGYAHAQDRLWQMDMMRRAGAGRLSEVVGGATLEIDRLMRGLGLYRVAEQNLARLPAETRALLEAYARGVNAVIEESGWLLPPEFLLLRYRPEPWRPADSVVWGRLMALQLSGNWRSELLRARLSERLTESQLEDLWPGYPDDAPISAAGLFDSAQEEAGILPWPLMPKSASNAWALAPSRSASGGALLANDPHLSLEAPGTWYLARIELPERTLLGATAPGVPFMVAGRNRAIAWGFTTTESDTQDLFVERLTEGRPGYYDAPEGPLPFETREEVIEIRGADPVNLTVRETRHGPVLSDVSQEAAAVAGPGAVLALAWPALAADDATAEGLHRLNRATDWDSFLEAMKRFHSPQQTILYADAEGHIGLVAPARVPIRRSGDGETPAPGWDGSHDWIGMIPFEALPRRLDPPRGRLVAANNRLVPPDYPHWLAADWANPERAERIEEVLDATSSEAQRGDMEDQQALQNDILSAAARRLLPLLYHESDDPAATRAQALLRDWDFRMDRTRPEPLIFAAWLDALNRALMADELGGDYRSFARPSPVRLAHLLEARVWCDDLATAEAEGCDAMRAASLGRALADLQAAYGEDMADWRWGEAHRAPLSHPILGRVPLLRELFDADLPTDGGNFTVNRAGAPFDGPIERRFQDRHGPGYRGIYDLADPEGARVMIATGQSGHPLSPHYLDLAERWRDGRYLTLEPPGEEAASRLVLRPE